MKISELVVQSLSQILAGIKGGQGRMGGAAIGAPLSTGSKGAGVSVFSSRGTRGKGEQSEPPRSDVAAEKGLLLNDAHEFFMIVEFDIAVMTGSGGDGKEDLVVAGERDVSGAQSRIRFSVPVHIPAP